MSNFDGYPFSFPQSCGKHMDFLKFFFTSEKRILETTFWFLHQLNDYSENDFVLN